MCRYLAQSCEDAAGHYTVAVVVIKGDTGTVVRNGLRLNCQYRMLSVLMCWRVEKVCESFVVEDEVANTEDTVLDLVAEDDSRVTCIWISQYMFTCCD